MVPQSQTASVRDASPVRDGWVRRWTTRLTRIAAEIMVLVTVLALCARLHWVAELTTHFRWQYCTVAVVTAAILMLNRRRWSALAALACGILHALPLLPLFVGEPSRPHDGAAGVRILVANLWEKNTDATQVLELVRRESPDVIVFQEVNEAWLKALQPLERDYPWSASAPQDSPFGIAAWSRIRPHEPMAIEERHTAELNLSILLAGTPIMVRGVHTVPPIGGTLATIRDSQLSDLGQRVRQDQHPTVVVGDLNVTPFSPRFRDFIDQARLVDGRHGRGVLSTWPTHNPLLRIPIDHCLTTNELAVVELRRGPDIGSDHFPLICEIAPRSL